MTITCFGQISKEICFNRVQLDSISYAINTIVLKNNLLTNQVDLYKKMTDVQSEIIRKDSVMIYDLRLNLFEYEKKQENRKKWYNNRLLYLGVGIVTGTILTLTL